MPSNHPSRRALLAGLGSAGAGAVLFSTATAARAAAPTSTGGPSYLPTTAANDFDPSTSVYNFKAANTRRHRASLGVAAAGGLASQVFIGDSLTAGCVGGNAFDRLHAWPRVYAATLANLGIPSAGTGLVRFVDNTMNDARWSGGTGWARYTSCGYAVTAGASTTFTSEVAGTSVAVAYVEGPGGGRFTVSVDGATSGIGYAVVPTAGPAKPGRVVLAGLPDTTHAVTVTTLSSAMVVLVGVEVFGSSGLSCHNVGQSGSRAAESGRASWSDTTSAGGSAQPLTIFDPASPVYGQVPGTVHCALGINDLVDGTQPADVVTALTTIRAACADSDFFLYLEPQPNEVSVDGWSAFATALYSLADTLDVPLFDLQDRLGGYATEAMNGLTGDTVAHLDRAGYAEWGRFAAMAAAR